VLNGLLKAAVAERDVRSVNYQVKAAGFPSTSTWPALTSRIAP
jgi:hypothetical protein